MKKSILFTWLILFSVLTVHAQSRQGFISTGQNVNVRTGPGLNYPLAVDEMSMEKCQLSKNQLVKYLGKKKNGFVYVQVAAAINEYSCSGWVSEKFLKPVKLCPSCNGEGYTHIEGYGVGRKCKRCNTMGYFK